MFSGSSAFPYPASRPRHKRDTRMGPWVAAMVGPPGVYPEKPGVVRAQAHPLRPPEDASAVLVQGVVRHAVHERTLLVRLHDHLHPHIPRQPPHINVRDQIVTRPPTGRAHRQIQHHPAGLVLQVRPCPPGTASSTTGHHRGHGPSTAQPRETASADTTRPVADDRCWAPARNSLRVPAPPSRRRDYSRGRVAT